jgi:hypothetical protein
MAKRLIFTFVWMAAGFVAAAIIGLSVAPLVPRVGITQEHTPTAMTFIAIVFALLPLIGIGIPLILGLRGKLPGTRRDV